MKFKTLGELYAWKPPQLAWFIEKGILLAGTKTCFFAGPKLFKSIIAQQMGFCLATGSPWLDFQTQQAKVLLLQAEIPDALFQARMMKMNNSFLMPVPIQGFMTESDLSFKLDRPAMVAELRKEVERLKPDILILDPWYKMLSMEDNHAYSKTQDILDTMIKDYGISIVIIHHDVKPRLDQSTGQNVESNIPRGPRTVEGWFDSIIHMTGNIATDKRRLHFELRHAEELLMPMDIVLDRNKLWAEKVIV